jgi:hypothetical protein
MLGKRVNRRALIILMIQVLGPFGAIGIAYLMSQFIK